MKPTLLVCAVLLSSIFATGQNPPTVNAQPNTVFVSADGKYEAAPDTAMIQFSIAAQEAAAKDAYTKASAQTEQLRQILRTNGVDPKSAEIGFFSLQPMYDYRNPKRKIVGYRVTTSVSLKLKDFSKVGPLVGAIGEQDWAEGVSVNYTLENIDAAKIKAVEDAFQRARSEASAIARAGGRTLGELSYASVDTSENVRPVVAPMARVMSMNAGVAAQPAPVEEFTPQTVSVTARVSTMFTLK
jgi:uncharacterized protein